MNVTKRQASPRGVRLTSTVARDGNWLARNWTRLNEETVGDEMYWRIALQNAAFYADTRPLIEKYVLDVGAGKLAWRPLLKRHATTYTSGDLIREHNDLDVLFDATGYYPFATGTFDTLFC
jgi:hypothetical protein